MRRAFVALSVVLLICCAGVGCTTDTVAFPPRTSAPTRTVYIADYGRHSSLLFPANPPAPAPASATMPTTVVTMTSRGATTTTTAPANRPMLYVEYTVGDWEWFAKGDTRWFVGLVAMIHSPQSTLGRRFVECSPDGAEPLREALHAESVHAVECPCGRVDAMRDKLDARFVALSRKSPPFFSNYSKLWHVRDPEPYCILRNCNQFTADWLGEMGCATRGSAILSKFYVDTDPAHYPRPEEPD